MGLQQLKVESFVTQLNGETGETVKGGSTAACYASVTAVVTAVEAIHEIGDANSWWHCTEGGGGNAGSEVVVPTPDGDACQLGEVVVNG